MRIHQAQVEKLHPKALNQSPKLANDMTKRVRNDALIRQEEKAGLFLPLIVGISAAAKTKLPTENTKSCHCIRRG